MEGDGDTLPAPTRFRCPPTTNTCTEISIDLPDPVDNFLGYVDDSCMVRFTPEQTQRMRLYLQGIGGVSSVLSTSNSRGWVAWLIRGRSWGLLAPSFPFAYGGTLWRLEGPEPISWEVWDAWGKITEGNSFRSFDEQVLPVLYVLVGAYAGLYTIRWYSYEGDCAGTAWQVGLGLLRRADF